MRPSADRPTDRPTEVVDERSRRHRQVEGDALNPKSNSMETEESGRALERRGCKKIYRCNAEGDVGGGEMKASVFIRGLQRAKGEH